MGTFLFSSISNSLECVKKDVQTTDQVLLSHAMTIKPPESYYTYYN